MSRQRSCLISRPRIVVFSASIEARYAVSHSGFDWATFSKRDFSSGCSAAIRLLLEGSQRPRARVSVHGRAQRSQNFSADLGEGAGHHSVDAAKQALEGAVQTDEQRLIDSQREPASKTINLRSGCSSPTLPPHPKVVSEIGPIFQRSKIAKGG